MSGVDTHVRLDAAEPPPDPTYEWEILIQAPFAFDFFKMIRGIFRLPARRHEPSEIDGTDQPISLRGYVFHVFLYNLGRIALILGMIPFTMLAFSYVATLPFLLMRALETAIKPGPTAAIAALGLIVSLLMPVWVVLQWFRPNWLRESYKKSKVELYNITMYLGLFLAAGMLETLIASPALPLHNDFTAVAVLEGTAGEEARSTVLDSTPQWTLFFADLSMNVLFANLPQKFLGPISDIRFKEPGRMPVSLGLLRLLLIVGFVTLVRLLAMKLCVNKTELFFGTRSEVRAYLPYCGRALARPIRKVIQLPLGPEEGAMREQFRYRVENGDDADSSSTPPGEAMPPAPPERGVELGDRLQLPADFAHALPAQETRDHD